MAKTSGRRGWRAIGVAVAAAMASAAGADPTLELHQLPGPGISLALSVSGLGATPIAGYQVFMDFDTSRVVFVSGAYVTDRIGLGIVNPIVAVGNQITVAAGINTFLGQQPTTANQDLVYLTFAPVNTGCQPRVTIRTNANPPTRLSDANGQAVLPLVIHSPWNGCAADYNQNGSVSVQDVFDFLQAWFAHDCHADFNGFSGVTVQDVFDFLVAWFAKC